MLEALTRRPNVYDYLKVLALIAMIVDHVWFLLYPDIEILRVVGRIAFPLFLFLVWYNHSYRVRPSLWLWGILLQCGMWAASYLWYIDMRYANILLAIWVTRVILWWVQRQNNIYLEVLLMTWALFFASSTAQRIDFGTLSIVFGVLWYRVRKRWRWLRSSWTILVIMMSYILYVQQWFDFTQTNFIIRWALWAIVTWSMIWMSRANTSLVIGKSTFDDVILRCSRNSLYLYVVQVVVIGLLYVVL